MKGAAGERRKGRSVTERTVKDCPASAAATEVASSSPSRRTEPCVVCTPSSLKSLPVATVEPPRATSVAPKGAGAAVCSKVPSMPHQVAELKRMRARSRSTTMRVATLWTRPAESLGMTLRHSTGETS